MRRERPPDKISADRWNVPVFITSPSGMKRMTDAEAQVTGDGWVLARERRAGTWRIIGKLVD